VSDEAAERGGLTIDELEDFAVPSYSLDADGKTELTVGDAKTTVRLSEDGHFDVTWRNADEKLVKSVPSHIKKAFGKETTALSPREWPSTNSQPCSHCALIYCPVFYLSPQSRSDAKLKKRAS
jgi:hypothetical protein